MCFRPSGVQGPDTSKIKCPECGKENMNSRKTCFACGAALPKAEAAAFPDAFNAAPKTVPSQIRELPELWEALFFAR